MSKVGPEEIQRPSDFDSMPENDGCLPYKIMAQQKQVLNDPMVVNVSQRNLGQETIHCDSTTMSELYDDVETKRTSFPIDPIDPMVITSSSSSSSSRVRLKEL